MSVVQPLVDASITDRAVAFQCLNSDCVADLRFDGCAVSACSASPRGPQKAVFSKFGVGGVALRQPPSSPGDPLLVLVGKATVSVDGGVPSSSQSTPHSTAPSVLGSGVLSS